MNNLVLSVLAIVALITIASIVGHNNANGLMYKVDKSEIIPYYTYSGISNVLDPSKSFEDWTHINLLIDGTDNVAVYSNEGSEGNFVLQQILTLKDD